MSYTGSILPISVGHGGHVGTRDQQSIGPDKLLIARNIMYDGLTLTKEGGTSKYNSSAISGTPSVLGGHDWWPVAGTQRMVVVLSDGTIKKDTGAGDFAVTLASGLTVSSIVPLFVEGGKEAAANNRKLFVFTGVNAVQVLAADGATTAALATPPADWTGANQPTFGFIHNGKLWGGGNANDPHRLYYSIATNHEDMTGAGSGSLSIYPGEGEKLVGAVSFKGLIVAWKYPKGIYIIDTNDATAANWTIRPHSRKIGGVGPRAMVEVDNDILFWDPAGNLHLLSAVQEFGDTSSSNLGKVNDISSFIKDNFNFARLGFIRGVY